MKAEDILDGSDRDELRNIVHRIRQDFNGAQFTPLTVVVNESPGQFPPADPHDVHGSLAWVNVRDYGAVGNGATDDTSAINAAIAALNAAGRGVLYFPAGKYLCTSGLAAITVDCVVMGDDTGGQLDFDTVYVSKVVCTSGTDNLFTIASSPFSATFRDLMLECTHSAPSAGTGIYVDGVYGYSTSIVKCTNIRVNAFYAGINIAVATEVYVDHCQLLYNWTIGIHLAYADFMITDSVVNGFHIGDAPYYGTTAIEIGESVGPGGIISGCRFWYYHDGITFETTSPVLQCSIVNNLFYGISNGNAISITGSSDPDEWFYSLLIASNNIEMLDPAGVGSSDSCIELTRCKDVVISGNNLVGADVGATCIALDTVEDARISGNLSVGFAAFLSQTGCSGIITDASAAAGKYRQFAWADDGSGGWAFISAGGEPVLHLADTE